MQDRVRTWLPPPHETEQGDQEDHNVQTPGTVRAQGKIRIVKWGGSEDADPCSTDGGTVCRGVWRGEGTEDIEEMSYKT